MANPGNPFGDLTAMMQQFKIPGLDIAPIIESRRKDMEALVEANKAAYAAMQALAQKQTEIMTEAMQGLQESAKGLMGSGLTDPIKQTELVRKAYEKALSDMKELAEMARQSQADTMAGITQRASQSMEEMKKLMRPK